MPAEGTVILPPPYGECSLPNRKITSVMAALGLYLNL